VGLHLDVGLDRWGINLWFMGRNKQNHNGDGNEGNTADQNMVEYLQAH
jgi:hypothetical protein